MDDEREYRFAVDEVGEDEPDPIETLRSADPEPGSPSIEGALFVALGAFVTTGALLMMVGVV